MKKFALALIMLLATTGLMFAQSDLQVLAVVKLNKSESITVKQLKSRVNSYEKQMKQKLSANDRKKILDAVIEERLMLQAAQKEGIIITDSAIDQYFLQGMSQQLGVNVTENELADIVKRSQGVTLDELLQGQVGMNVAEYKAYLKTQLTIQQYVVQKKQAEIQAVVPTDEEIRMYYESNKASFVWNDMLKVFLVIVPKANNAEKAKLTCNDLRNKYVEKKLSAEQITVQSRVEGSGYQAGDLLLPKTEVGGASIGLPYSSLVYLFEQKEGYISDLQETEVDYRFISVGKKYNAKLLGLSDIVQPETTVTVYDFIRSNIGQQKQLQYVQFAAQQLANELHTDANVEMKKSGDALSKLLAWGE